MRAFNKAVTADPIDLRFDNNRRKTLIKLGEIQTALAGLSSDRASVFLNQAGDQARTKNDLKFAQYLYRKSLELSPRHQPNIARKLEELQQRRFTR